MSDVKSYINYFAQLWDESPEYFPDFSRMYSLDEQISRELKFDEVYEKLNDLRTKKNRRALRSDNPGITFFPVFRNFLENVFDFEAEHLEIILSDNFRNVSKDFFY